MAMKTQGTRLYAIDPVDDSVLSICVVSGIDIGSPSASEIPTTTLCDSVKRYLAGMRDAADVSFTIDFDPSDANHLRLAELQASGDTIKFALGCSDGVAPPTVLTDEFVLPTTRTWVKFRGFLKDFPLSFSEDSVIKTQVGVRMDGGHTIVPKT